MYVQLMGTERRALFIYLFIFRSSIRERNQGNEFNELISWHIQFPLFNK